MGLGKGNLRLAKLGVLWLALASALTAHASAIDLFGLEDPPKRVVRQSKPKPRQPVVRPERDHFETEAGSGEVTRCTTGRCPENQRQGLAPIPVRFAAAEGRGDYSEYANRVAQGALNAANKCRNLSNNRKRREGIAVSRTVNSCSYWGRANNMSHSKGWCAAAVREALSEAGVRLSPGDAHAQRRKLASAGMVKTTYDPRNVPAGTVLICDGGGSRCEGGPGGKCGHIEIVTISSGQRLFCSDFCSRNPTCSNGKYYNLSAYKFPGS